MTYKYLSSESKHTPVVRNRRVFHSVSPVRLVPERHVISSLRTPLIQTKLRIGAANDKYEQEADRVVDQVMSMPTSVAVQTQSAPPHIQRFCPECEDEVQRQMQPGFQKIKPYVNAITPLVQRQEEPEEEEEELLQPGSDTEDAIPEQEHEDFPILESVETRDAGEMAKEEEDEYIQPKGNTGSIPQVTPNIANNIHTIKGTGQPLPASERAFFEPRFGWDFSHVRIHADQRAADTAQSINARAFTSGDHVVFGAGQFVPGNQLSRKLLSHELVHVIQQHGVTTGTRSSVSNKLQCKKHTRRASKYVSRATAQTAIEAYLKRANAAQNKGQINPTLTVTQTIKTDLLSLIKGDIGRILQLDNLLNNQTHLHGDSVVLARHVATLLPDKVERSRVAKLADSSGTRKQIRLERLKNIFKPKSSLTSPTQRAVPVRGPTSLGRFERGSSQLRKSQGLPKIKTFGPYSADAAAGVRQVRKLTTKSARPRKTGQKFPEVEKSLGQFGTNSLVPGNVLIAIKRATKAWEWAGPDEEPRRLRELKAARARTLSYASPHLVARNLAQSMVTGDSNISLMLDDIYNKVRQRKAIYSELERIIRTVHNRLGNRAVHVATVDVYFGSMLVRQIRLKSYN